VCTSRDNFIVVVWVRIDIVKPVLWSSYEQLESHTRNSYVTGIYFKLYIHQVNTFHSNHAYAQGERGQEMPLIFWFSWDNLTLTIFIRPMIVGPWSSSLRIKVHGVGIVLGVPLCFFEANMKFVGAKDWYIEKMSPVHT